MRPVVVALTAAVVLTSAVVPVRGSISGPSFPAPRYVEIAVKNSPFADYLFYVFYRQTGDYPALATEVPLEGVPTLDATASVAEITDSQQVRSYDEIFPLLEPYKHATGRVYRMYSRGRIRYRILSYSNRLPSYSSLVESVRGGRSHYPEFERFWKRSIAPAEEAQMAAWRSQLETRPLETLQRIERLRFPFDHLDVGAIAPHLAGSGNTDPVGVYTSLFPKPNIYWVLGHEATHIMVDNHVGAKWASRPRAAEAIALVKAHGGTEYDIEEALCILMQAKLSQMGGQTRATYRQSTEFPPSVRRSIIESMENGWEGYLKAGNEDIIDFMLACTIDSLATDQPQPSPSP